MTTSLKQQNSLFSLSDGPLCQKCRKEIGSDASFQAAGFIWHASGCFTCSYCFNDISESFVEKYRRIFCIDCDRKLFGNYCGEKLGVHTRDTGCGEVITSEFLEANDTLFHPSCLTCNKCHSSSAEGELFLYENNFYCKQCVRLIKV